MMLNIGAIKHCLELYKYHLCHEDGDENYELAIDTINNIREFLPHLLEHTLTREQMVAQFKDIKIKELKEKMKTNSFESVIGEFLDEGSFPLTEECESYMCEQIALANLIILP
jgi:ribosome maturation protein Sdo1